MPEKKIVRVSLREHSYDVVVQRGVINEIGERLRAGNQSKSAIILTASDLPKQLIARVKDSVEASGFSPHIVTLPPGEAQKSLDQIVKIFDEILPLKPDRQTPLIALGGGVIGDITGFVAATLLRGVPFVQIPTTLLSMVDASVGGKTGVNHAVGKNLIGAFHQPIAVFADPETLTTLPPRELRGGLAECIKHEIIRDADGFASLEKNIGRAMNLDLDYLAELIAHNVAIKANVVMADPLERGERAHLNFGHTFGHAIETVVHYSYSHGECVALGIVAAAYTAEKLGMIDEKTRVRVVNLIRAADLPTKGLTADVNAIVLAMAFDKKNVGSQIRFVLPDRIGHVVMRDDVPTTLVREAIESLR